MGSLSLAHWLGARTYDESADCEFGLNLILDGLQRLLD